MVQLNQVRGTATTIRTDKIGTKEQKTIVQYHDTDVVSFNNQTIKLDNGNYLTSTTRNRMNQASNQFGLGYKVSIKKGIMYVTFKGKTLKFYGHFRILDR